MEPSRKSELPSQTCIGSEEWIERLYADLHRLASSYLKDEPATVSLSPTVVIHELYLRLPEKTSSAMTRSHFFAVAATSMRHILVDHARHRKRKKRGGGAARRQLYENDALSITDSEQVLAIDEALQELSKLDQRQAKIVELRFFAGMTVAEVSEHLKLSKRTIEAEWTMAKAWLRRWLNAEDTAD